MMIIMCLIFWRANPRGVDAAGWEVVGTAVCEVAGAAANVGSGCVVAGTDELPNTDVGVRVGRALPLRAILQPARMSIATNKRDIFKIFIFYQC